MKLVSTITFSLLLALFLHTDSKGVTSEMESVNSENKAPANDEPISLIPHLSDCMPVEAMCMRKAKEKPIVFREDFNGSSIDESIWTIGTWTEHEGQLGRERCYIEDGYLNLLLINDNGTCLSSAIQSNQDFLYGKWEVRLKASSVYGVLNSFYTIDWNNRSTTDPNDGTKQEIDIEFLTHSFGENKGQVHIAVHAQGYKSFDINPDIDLGFDPSVDFHIWGFNITPKHIEWFVDGKTLYTYVYDERDVKINSPYQLKLNHWTKKDWILGPPESGVVSRYLVDWIQFTPYE